VSFIDFTSFHLIYSFDLISLYILPGDDPEGALEIREETKTSQELVEIRGIHGTPPQNRFFPVTAMMKFSLKVTTRGRKSAKVPARGMDVGKRPPGRAQPKGAAVRRPLRRGVTHVSPRRGEKE